MKGFLNMIIRGRMTHPKSGPSSDVAHMKDMGKGSFAFPCLPSHLVASSSTLLDGLLQDSSVTENQFQYQIGTAETGPPVR